MPCKGVKDACTGDSLVLCLWLGVRGGEGVKVPGLPPFSSVSPAVSRGSGMLPSGARALALRAGWRCFRRAARLLGSGPWLFGVKSGRRLPLRLNALAPLGSCVCIADGRGCSDRLDYLVEPACVFLCVCVCVCVCVSASVSKKYSPMPRICNGAMCLHSSV